MNTINMSSCHCQPEYFLLMGIPGLENHHFLLSIPFCAMYLLALVGNNLLIFIIATNESLHQPMYFFLTILAVTDLFLCSTTVPKTLTIFWFGSHEISFNDCLTQVFWIHFIFAVESAILLIMACDRFFAICKPLTYSATFTPSFIRKLLIIALVRGICIITPFVFLLKRLPFHKSNIISHTYCEHMGVARLATANIRINVVYGLIIAFGSTGIDLILIAVSYVVIIRTVVRLPASEARYKAFNTCVSHICVILMFYLPAFFSFIAHRIGHKHIPPRVHIMLANLYVLVPPMMNPLIYGVKTKEIRQKIIMLFSLFSYIPLIYLKVPTISCLHSPL
ncbi:olfactory receptor 52D1-like [Bombina bombina]|uniref:olfactory receptor 52D1-like n=1 Tax=Bombina bombina TaxID=8345 RepID=UPI00235A7910|nr:olfactory receptor 52D1-like [Bombina bombina]